MNNKNKVNQIEADYFLLLIHRKKVRKKKEMSNES